MQEPDHVVANPPGRGLRRGKRLPPIQTTFTPDPIRNVQRPPPVETIIYKTSPERPMPPPAPPAANRRGFLGLFSRSKSVKDFQSQEYRSAMAERDDSRGRKGSSSSGMSGSKSVESKSKKSASTRKERPQRSVMTLDPPPLFQAYSQSVKVSTLPAPTISADRILRIEKEFQARQKSDVSVLDSIAHGAPLPFEEGALDETTKRLRKGTHTSDARSWTTKVFVLTTSGFLLQYSGDGHHDRLPEKMMQLTSDSAAFASDAIPGRHWVLQVTSSFSEEGAANVPASKSVFSKLSSRVEAKRSVNNFLLVMESPEDMNSWLVAVRKEIQALGGQSYRPDEVARKDPAEVIQQLQQKPSRRFLIQRNPDPVLDQGEPSPKGFAPREEAPSTSSDESPASATRPFLSQTKTNMSETSQSTVRPLFSNRSLDAKFQGSSDATQADLKVTPISSGPKSTAPPSLLKWELPANFTPSFSSAAIGFPHNDSDVRRESMSSVPSLSSQGRSHRSLSEQSDSQAPNFSLPTFSNRFSHSTKSGTITTPPTSSGSAFRGASPVSPLEETPPKRNAPLIGELPTIVKHTSWSKHSDVPEITEEIDGSTEWEDVEDLQPLPTRIQKTPHPKRFSSLGNKYNLFPQQSLETTQLKQQNSSQTEPLSPRRYSAMDFPSNRTPRKSQRLSYLPPQHPPPTGALPAIPSGGSASMDGRPSTSPKLRRPASMQIRPVSRPNPINFTPAQPTGQSASSASLRERRSFMGRPSSHMLGPPAAPPPSNPLPEIPPVKPVDRPVHDWTASNSKTEAINA